jgi:hypothetical protein
MSTGHLSPQHPRPIFRGLEQSIERVLGADLRLLYGMAVPILVVIGLIILLGLGPSPWVVAGVMVFEVAALGVILVGLLGMMSDDPDEDADTH